MAQATTATERRTGADEVFDFLHGQIASLKLMPGARISEAEVAKRFDLSRQPVREAFIRLANIGLIQIRPQRATLVRRFSYEAIQRSRFIRLSIECEALRRACAAVDEERIERLRRALDRQGDAVAGDDIDRFHALDYDFHQELFAAAGCGFAFKTVQENKAMVDRICLLSLSKPTEMNRLLADHEEVVEGLVARDEDAVVAAMRTHLSRLDGVIAEIRKSHADYFED